MFSGKGASKRSRGFQSVHIVTPTAKAEASLSVLPGRIPTILSERMTLRSQIKKAMKEKRYALSDGRTVVGILGRDGVITRPLDRDQKAARYEPVPVAAGSAEGAPGLPSVVSEEGAHDSFTLALYDAWQLAVKTLCNSIYGQLGSSTSAIRCKQLAAATTAGGREMMGLVISTFKGWGYEVVYGDTDSVFVTRPGQTGEDAYEKMARDCERFTRDHLPSPHELEFEKIFRRFLILSRKRYIARVYTAEGSAAESLMASREKLLYMGSQLKRRDSTELVKDCLRVIGPLIMDGRCDEACDYVKRKIADLTSRRVPSEHLTITKSVRSMDKYVCPPKHVILNNTLKIVDPEHAVSDGDRLEYMHVVPEGHATFNCKSRSKKVPDELDVPARALKRGRVANVVKYLEDHLRNPICEHFAARGVLESLSGYDPDLYRVDEGALERHVRARPSLREAPEAFVRQKIREERNSRRMDVAEKIVFGGVLFAARTSQDRQGLLDRFLSA